MTLLLSTDTDSGTVSVFDYGSDDLKELKIIDVGNGPRGAVRFTKAGLGYVTNHAGNTLSEIDMKSLEEVGRIEVGIAPIGLQIFSKKYAIVSNSGDDDASIVDLQKRVEIGRVPIGREPRHPDVTPDDNFAYLPISRDDAVAKVDLAPLKAGKVEGVQVIKRISVGKGAKPYSCAVSPDGSRVVVANNQQSYVSIIDTKTDEIVHKVEIGSKGARGTAYTEDGSAALVTIEDIDEIVAIDVATGKIFDRYATGPGPRGLFFDAKLNRVGSAAFARAARFGRENTVSLINFGPQPLVTEKRDTPPEVIDIQVGAGPCSVVLFDAR